MTIGSPRIVPVGDGFGYRLEDGAGFRVPWPVLPVDRRVPRPVHPERRHQARAADRSRPYPDGDARATSPSRCGSERTPRPSWPSACRARPRPSSRRAPRASHRDDGTSCRRRSSPGRTASRCGGSSTAARCPSASPGSCSPRWTPTGSATVGGHDGFSAVIDELGVYYRDDAGRPATDPTLLRQALRRQHGDRLLLADGFDGMFLPAGFTARGKAALGAGRLALSPEASLELPPIRSCPRKASRSSWSWATRLRETRTYDSPGRATPGPSCEARVVASSGILRLRIRVRRRDRADA